MPINYKRKYLFIPTPFAIYQLRTHHSGKFNACDIYGTAKHLKCIETHIRKIVSYNAYTRTIILVGRLIIIVNDKQFGIK